MNTSKVLIKSKTDSWIWVLRKSLQFNNFKLVIKIQITHSLCPKTFISNLKFLDLNDCLTLQWLWKNLTSSRRKDNRLWKNQPVFLYPKIMKFLLKKIIWILNSKYQRWIKCQELLKFKWTIHTTEKGSHGTIQLEMGTIGSRMGDLIAEITKGIHFRKATAKEYKVMDKEMDLIPNSIMSIKAWICKGWDRVGLTQRHLEGMDKDRIPQ